MTDYCKFIFTQHLKCFFYLSFIIMSDSFTALLNVLLCNYLDLFITFYHTQYPFYLTPLDNNDTTTATRDPTSTSTKKPAPLLVDTACPPNKDACTNTIQFKKTRYQSYSEDCHHSHPQLANCDVPPLLFSPTSSVSSFGSTCNWSPKLSNAGKRSKVEEMIHFFENGHCSMDQHRRYSIDSHLNCRKKTHIRERWYEYQPTVGEWNKRINGDFPSMQLSESKSTPVQRSKRKMIPVMEASKSLWG
ncbi:hypothetical protein BD408DRAFT_425942 [Parasitella parasitica]|nr:hypothetical protein BD408DRAFT_425942 [Parasitella parasitica]